ncbi:MAG: ABC transporter permease [Acidobacteriaceae bacterium]
MHALRQNLAYSFRRLSRAPGFVFAIILSIGLGIAANSTIFSMVSRFVLRPAPVGDPASLVALHTTHDGDRCCNSFSWPLYEDVREQARSFSGVAAYYELLPASIGGAGEPERVWGQGATSNYFDVSQIRMQLGRGFLPGEERLPIIVLSYRLWQRRFASDPAIVGKAIVLSGRSFTVVGVAPNGFRGLDLILDPEFWVTLGNVEQLVPSVPSRNARDQHWLAVVGRLAPSVRVPQAAAELASLAQRYARVYPDSDKGGGFLLTQAGSLPPRDRSTVLLFIGALAVVVLLLLGIACANVANLLLAQSADRQREMAVRIALGATRGHLLRQLLLESLLLALAGGVFGTLLTFWATSALSAFHIPAPVPLDTTISVDWRVLSYTFVLSVGAGLVFGFGPAWMAARPILSNALKGEDGFARPGRMSLRNILVVTQIVLSLVLLCATGLFLRSLENAVRMDVGFRSRDLLMVSVDPRVHGYSPERTARFLDLLRQRAATIPGVVSAAGTDSVPLNGGNRSDDFHAEGEPNSIGTDSSVELYMATPGYFETMGIPRLAGRDFAEEPAKSTKVAIVNRAFAEHFFPRQNAIGRRVTDGGVAYEVIGVVENIKSRTLGEDTRFVLFRSLAQSTESDPSLLGYQLLLHFRGDPGPIVSAVRRQIRDVDPALAVYDIRTMDEHLRQALFLPRLAGTLFGVFGFSGLTLAAIGLYSVMSYSVSRRTREIGIRIALGAQLDEVRGLVLRQGMVLTIIAMAIGLPAAFALAGILRSFLYGIRPHDTITFTAVPVFLAAVACLACWIPAYRAARIDPQRALRYE